MRADRREHWTKLIAEQEESGLGVRAFCLDRRISVFSFYQWRRRLRSDDGAVHFARIEARPAPAASGEGELELVFPTGERLRIPAGVDGSTLRLVLAAVRA